MKKRTKIIVLAAMIMLLGVTGYLNLSLNNRLVDAGTGTVVNTFEEYAATRDATHQKQILLFDSIINSESTTQEAKQKAQEDKLALIAVLKTEVTIENLLKPTFPQVLVSYTNGYVNVIVKGDLDRPQVAQIVSVVKQQVDVHSDYITITPV
ncbi:MAG: SpoIIIAH-like family protein [Christensenellales bacterium]|mgnify:CR=1 FL=1|jgi:hypothetical protein